MVMCPKCGRELRPRSLKYQIICRCGQRCIVEDGVTRKLDAPPVLRIAVQREDGAPPIGSYPLRADEASKLFPDEDQTLLGNRIKALTDALGIPPCGGCEKRRQWLNKAHAWLRGQ
jgi:hypothetical protein